MTIRPVDVAEVFAARFGVAPTVVVRAPGRVNIIGEHTDYNGGFVLPMAIDRDTVLTARPRTDGKLRAYAANLNDYAEVALQEITRNAASPWLNYVLGVALELDRLGHTPVGADLVVQGDVPIGAGLSSSASLEMAACLLFERLGGFRLTGPEAARLGQRVENRFLGLNSGIMDQFISRMAKRGHALFLDCRSLEHRLVPLRLPDAVFVIANTNAPHSLTSSKYNERVQECRRAVEALNKQLGHSGNELRDFTPEDIDAAASGLDPVLFRRARHVVTENARTVEACAAMEAGDVALLGRLMNASHESLRADYEVTHDPEHGVDLLTAMASIAQTIPGCHGARMTGGGFGGSTINVVERERAEEFATTLLSRYEVATGLRGAVIVSSAGAGAEVLWPDE